MLKASLLLARSGARLRRELFDDQAGLCVVHGDTASTLVSALVARRAGQRVAHLEAGLRSHRLLNPFPEELIRIAVMRRADLLFAPSTAAMRNLEAMGLATRAVLLPGNTNLDMVALTLRRAPKALPGLPEGYALASFHRFETLYNRRRLGQVVQFLLEAHRRAPLVLVLHPPTEKRLAATGWARDLRRAGVHLLPLVEHSSFLHLLRSARFVLTDGGSVQEEASYLGTPCLLLRRVSERDDGLGRNVVLSELESHKVRAFLDRFEDLRQPDRTAGFESPSAAVAEGIGKMVGGG